MAGSLSMPDQRDVGQLADGNQAFVNPSVSAAAP